MMKLNLGGSTKKIERDYLVSEIAHRKQTTAKYVDESYQWTGGFA
jgi:hypothetical protein